jgi:DNA-binding NarL/FixJ family response regulator
MKPSISFPDTSFWLEPSLFHLLDPREWKVLILLVDGFADRDIMTALNLKTWTMINVKISLSSKLRLSGEDHLAYFCQMNRDLILYWYTLRRSS